MKEALEAPVIVLQLSPSCITSDISSGKKKKKKKSIMYATLLTAFGVVVGLSPAFGLSAGCHAWEHCQQIEDAVPMLCELSVLLINKVFFSSPRKRSESL